MRRHVRLPFTLLAAAMLSVALAACGSTTPRGAVHVLRYSGDVDPVMEGYLDRGFSRAENNSAKLVVLELDTPGGYDTSMRAIVQRIERTKVPVVVYVYPAGARAASAGTFITMAANIAVMAPNTAIGAASPVNSNGSDITGTLGTKVMNDAVSYIRGIAQLRGRNADWAEQAVRNAISADQSVAVDQHVVDFVSPSLPDLLQKIDGTTTQTGAGQDVKLEGLTTAPIVETNVTAWEHFVTFLADPTLASLLITIGFIALLLELWHPGLVVPGVTGVICLALGFIGLNTLPVDTVGVILIGAGLAFIAIDLVVQSGMLAFGGILALVLGAIIAFRGSEVRFGASWIVVLIAAVFLGGMLASLGMAIAAVRKKTAETGTSALLGKIAIARTPLTPDGTVFIQGERWQAQLDDGTAREGDRVRIIGAKGFRLRVHKEDSS